MRFDLLFRTVVSGIVRRFARGHGFAGFALLLAVFVAAPLRAELEYPRLLSITRESPARAKLGDTVSYRFTVQPGAAPITAIAGIWFSSPARDFHEVRSTNVGSGVLSFPIDSEWVDGPYIFQQVSLTDSWGRTVTYSSEELSTPQVVATPSQPYAGPSTHSFNFASLGVTVTDAISQRNFSELAELTPLSTGVLAPGAVARFRYVVKPGVTPWSRLTLAFRTSTGFAHTVIADLTAPSGEIAIPILAEMANGRYDYSSVQLGGTTGGYLLYGSPTGRSVTKVIGALSLPTGLDYFSSGDPVGFTVADASATAAVTLLSAWTHEGGAALSSGGTLKFNYVTTPGPYGVRSVSLRISGPYGGARNFTLNAASGTFTIPVDADWTPGPYTVSTVTVVDNAGRIAGYSPNGVLNVTGGTRPTTTHSFPTRLSSSRCRARRSRPISPCNPPRGRRWHPVARSGWRLAPWAPVPRRPMRGTEESRVTPVRRLRPE